MRKWLVFEDGTLGIRRFLKPGFGHVKMLMRDEFNWVLANPCRTKLEVTILPFKTSDDVPGILARKATVVMIEADDYDDKNISFLGFVKFGCTCVSIMEYLIGYKFFAFTPYQFYKKLMAKKYKFLKYVQKVKAAKLEEKNGD